MSPKPQTVRILCRQLRPGMKVVELDRPWAESPFTSHGFKISSQQQIQQLSDCCEYVYVQPKQKESTDTQGRDFKRQLYKTTQAFQQVLPQAKSNHRQAKNVVKGLFKSLRLGQSIDAAAVKRSVKQCVDSIIANPDAMLWLGLLKDVDEYTAEHSLNVALLSIILGRAEGLCTADLELVGLCGMLHDMGKSQIPLEILNKEGAFSDEEFALMKTHATLGYKILRQLPDIPTEAAEAAYGHHERLNSRGYPNSLPAEQIPYLTRIVAIADTYDAITSKRVYSPAKSALDGLQILMGAKGSHFDPELIKQFIECIGVYPAGSIAELSSGEIGIVLPTARDSHNLPKVLVVRGTDKKTCPEKMLNLSESPKDKKGNLIKIHHLLSDGAFGIDIKGHHERGGEQGG